MKILELFMRIHWIYILTRSPLNSKGEYKVCKPNISIYPLKVEQKNQKYILSFICLGFLVEIGFIKQ
jgi:hypothetical protein